MAWMTPGISFILIKLVHLFLPPLVVHLLIQSTYLEPSCGKFLVFASLLTFPVLLAARTLWKVLRIRRRASQRGARLAPIAKGKSFGNLDIADFMHEEWENGYAGDGILKLHQKYGAIYNVQVLWDDLIVTSSPEHTKQILVSNFNNYVKGDRFHRAMFSVLGNGVFNTDGDMWKFHRSMSRPAFTRDRISDFELFDHHAMTAIDLIKQRMREGYALDFQDLMSRFTLDTASSFLFGTCLNSLSSSLPYPSTIGYDGSTSPSSQSNDADSFARAFLRAQEILSIRERNGWAWPLKEIFEDKTKGPMKVIRAYLEKVVSEAVKKRPASTTEKVVNGELQEGETLLDHLVRVTDDETLLRDETLNILIAGRDTTASTLTFIIYLLATHPQVLQRLRAEILEKVGSQRRPDYNDIKEMKYLRAVINETLRLFPIVPFNTRNAVNEDVWSSPDPAEKPIYIPAGTKVTYCVFIMHRRKDLWGPDAEIFDPDRFLDDRLHKYLMKNPFIFLPFNAGPRICLGQQFAYNEMSFMLIRLLQSFSSIELDGTALREEHRPSSRWQAEGEPDGRRRGEKVWPKVHLTMHVGGGLWVKMQEDKSADKN